MKYRIISVGKIREPFYRDGINEYMKRIKPYAAIELLDSLEEKLAPNAGEKEIEKILSKEADKILNHINENEILVLLDLKGQQLDSTALAQQMNKWNMSGASRINLVIGSSYGLASELHLQADFILAFSPLTFPHQMAGLILAEQIYRGFKILKREPYHK